MRKMTKILLPMLCVVALLITPFNGVVSVSAATPDVTQSDALLSKYDDGGKEPNFMAKTMSHMKTEMKMGWDNSDATAADLITDGCNMGVKSLNRYLNQYKAADEVSKDITKRLINLEQQLSTDIRQYL